MELLMLREGIKEEPKKTIDRFHSGINLEIWERVKFLPFDDLNDLIHVNVRIEQQLKRRSAFKEDHPNTFCSGRLTWDVFVRNLARQLGTPSHWLPVDSCKEGQRGALAAICTPTLKSASKKHQKLYTSVSEHREWHSEGGQRNCV